MNWRDYENEIFKYFQETYPETDILFDQKVIGKYSKVERQIDILIKGEIAGYTITIVVDCKFFNSKIDVKDVESFSSMVEDLDANQGILITHNGYSQAAINRAFYGGQKIELDIINFDDLKKFQALNALPYSGNFCMFLSAPFGWIIDLTEKIHQLPVFFQRGSTFKDAQLRNEYIYFEFFKILSSSHNIDFVIENQNSNILEFCPNVKFEYKVLRRKDEYSSKIKISYIERAENPYVEAAGYIQYETHIFMVFLITPKELLGKNLRKLEYLLSTAKSGHIDFDNSVVIEQHLSKLDSSQDNKEKAEIHYKIAIWYKEMNDKDNALDHLRKSITFDTDNYVGLKLLINEELEKGNVPESLTVGRLFFELAPKNPTMLKDIIEIFMQNEKEVELINFIKERCSEHEDDEVLGNLFFHLGMVELNTGREDQYYKDFKLAKEHFEKVFASDHYVFKELKKLDNL